MVPDHLDHFLPRMTESGNSFTNKVATSADVAAMSRAALLWVEVPVLNGMAWETLEEDMVPPSLLTTLTGHSERCTLPSLSAILGLGRSERDYLGRWTPSGSDEYVRTSKRVVRQALTLVVSAATGDGAYEATDEAEAYEKMAAKKVKEGGGKEEIDADLRKAKDNAKKVFEDLKKAKGTNVGNGIVNDIEEEMKDTKASQASGPVAPPGIEEGEDEKEAKEEKSAKYVVSEVRRSHGWVCTLHSRTGCYRGRGLSFRSYELIFDDTPPAASYQEVCRTCWPMGPPSFDVNATGGTEVSDRSASTSPSSSDSE